MQILSVMTYRAPDVPTSQITPHLVRDELLKCFESANMEFLKIMNQPIEDAALKEQVHQFVTTVFQGCGVSFDQPNKQGIVQAISECKNRAKEMMGPRGTDIINHHYDEMIKLVNKLED